MSLVIELGFLFPWVWKQIRPLKLYLRASFSFMNCFRMILETEKESEEALKQRDIKIKREHLLWKQKNNKSEGRDFFIFYFFFNCCPHRLPPNFAPSQYIKLPSKHSSTCRAQPLVSEQLWMSTREGEVGTQGTEREGAAEDVPGTAPCQATSSTWQAGWGPNHLVSQPTSQHSLICLIRTQSSCPKFDGNPNNV